ncbi:MAG: GDSL-type esterase/lipase family protein [Lachnospiraceae bacterium]|nr:GDSL-type esterase/lipase family protein [Lachnospiraceae bacterium]
MSGFKKFLITLFCMVLVLAIGAGIYFFVDKNRKERFEEERQVRVEEISASTDQIKLEIEEISNHSQEEIQKYIEEKAYVEDTTAELQDLSQIHDTWNIISDDEIAVMVDGIENSSKDDENSVSGNNIAGGADVDDSENGQETVSGNSMDGESKINIDDYQDGERSVSDNSLGFSKISEDEAENNEKDQPADSVSENKLDSDDSSIDSKLSENEKESEGEKTESEDASEGAEDGDEKSDEELQSEDSADEETEHKLVDHSLAERQLLRSSYDETMLWIEADDNVLADADMTEFEGKKIACLGDSITEACTRTEPDKIPIAYPTKLREVLQASEVTNLGIGGASLGRYWYMPFCDRYQEIPEDTDIIFVMGGTNDGFCLTEDLIGNIEDREPNTLYGDVNDLMSGLKNDYPNAEIVFMTPLPNVTHDILRKEREGLLPQTVVVNCILELANEYGFEIIDLYNSNFFDSHDSNLLAEYLPDGTHPNPDGYNLLARHIAAELIRLHEQEEGIKTEEDEMAPADNDSNLEDADEKSDDRESEDESDSGESEESDNENVEDEDDVNSNKPESEKETDSKSVFYSRDDEKSGDDGKNNSNSDSKEGKTEIYGRDGD